MYMLDTLILGGGGYKGLAYVGMLRALDELKLLRGFRKLVGCSIGGVVLFLHAIGYRHTELIDFVRNFDFGDVSELSVMNFPDRYGLESGDKIVKLLRIMLKRKMQCEDISFSELYDRTGLSLCLNTVCLNTRELIYLDKQNYPELSVIMAVRMTVSLPILFTPVQWKNKYYVDGGLLQNFPIRQGEPGRTLGVGFCRDNSEHNINGIESFLMGIWTCIYRNANRLEHPPGYQIVMLDLSRILGSVEFDISRETRHQMYLIGYQQTLKKMESLGICAMIMNDLLTSCTEHRAN